MAIIAGKYALTNIGEFEDFLKREGLPEEKVKSMIQGDHFLKIKSEGLKLSINEHFFDKDHVSDFVLGEKVENKTPRGTMKTTAKLDDNVLSLESETAEGKTHVKSYIFTGETVEVEMPSHKGGAALKQIFKRV